jgi:Fe2+ or Zn2+ uptake regulation protein
MRAADFSEKSAKQPTATRCTNPPDRIINMNNESQRKLKIKTVYRYLQILKKGGVIQIISGSYNVPQAFLF